MVTIFISIKSEFALMLEKFVEIAAELTEMLSELVTMAMD